MTILKRLKIWWFYQRHPKVEKLGPEGKTVFSAANQAAIDSKAIQIDTGHLLLGILRTTSLLKQLGLDQEQLEREILSKGDRYSLETDHAKNVLEASIDEARKAGLCVIGPKFLLAGLCRMDGTIAQNVLANHSVSIGKVLALRNDSQVERWKFESLAVF